jgi:hypothetical protein
MSQIRFTARDLDDDITEPHDKVYEKLSLAPYSEEFSFSKVYSFADKYYDNKPKKGKKIPEKVSEFDIGSSATNKSNIEKAVNRIKQDPAYRKPVYKGKQAPEVNTPEEDNDIKDKGIKSYREFDEKGIRLPAIMRLSQEELAIERERALSRYNFSGAISQGDPDLKVFDDIVEHLWKLTDQRGYINRYLEAKEGLDNLYFNKTQLDKDVLLQEENKKHDKEIKKDYKRLSKEIDNMEFSQPTEEILRDIKAMTDFAVSQNGINKAEMSGEQKEFYYGVLRPMEREISKQEGGEKDIKNEDGSFNLDKLGHLYIETKEKALDKELKKKKGNDLSM